MYNQRDNEDPQVQQRYGGIDNLAMPHMGDKFPFSSQQGGDPRQENFFQFLKQVFCPQITVFSFTFMIVIINIIIFAFTCYLGLKIPGTLFQVDYDVLQKYGNHPISVYEKNQIWRWVTACFMHADFLHLFFNTFCIMVVGSMIEKAQGKFETCLLYILSGISGNIFSSAVGQDPNEVSVGASTCIYGLLAGLVSYMILNWDAMKPYSQQRNFIMCILCSIIAFIIFMSLGPGNTSLDYNGHMGGFIGGLFFSFIIFTPFAKKDYEKKCKIVGIVLSTCYVILMLLTFYTIKF